MTTPSNGKINGTGTRAFGGVVALLAIVAGVYAMVEPMSQRIEFQNRQIDTMREDLQRHASLNNHPWGVVAEIATLEESLREVETQFADTERRIADYERWRETWEQKYPASNASQDERIKALERIVYQDHPALMYKAEKAEIK